MALGFLHMGGDTEGDVTKRMRERRWFGDIVSSGKRVLCGTGGRRCEKVFGNGPREMLQGMVETERLDIFDMKGNGFQIIELCNKF